MKNKERYLAQLEVIKDMTETEGVKQLCYLLIEMIDADKTSEIGFKNEKSK